MRRFGSASPETLLPYPSHPFSLLENSRDVLLSLAPSLMAGSLIFLLLLVFLLLLFLLLVCRPWRFFVRNSRPIEVQFNRNASWFPAPIVSIRAETGHVPSSLSPRHHRVGKTASQGKRACPVSESNGKELSHPFFELSKGNWFSVTF